MMYLELTRKSSRRAGMRALAWGLAAAISASAHAQSLTALAADRTAPALEAFGPTATLGPISFAAATLHVYPGAREIAARIEIGVDGGALGPHVLNVQADVNHDGVLTDDEWVVRNQSVVAGGDGRPAVLSLPFPLSTDPTRLHGAISMIRVALGTLDWASPADTIDGGEVTARIEFLWPESSGEPLPLLGFECPPRIELDASLASELQCEVVAHTPSAASLSYTLEAVSGAVEIDDAIELRGRAAAPAVLAFSAFADDPLPARWRYTTRVDNGPFAAGLSAVHERLDLLELPLDIVVHPSGGDILFVAGEALVDAVRADSAMISAGIEDAAPSPSPSLALPDRLEGVEMIGIETTTPAVETTFESTIGGSVVVETTLEESYALCGCEDPEPLFDTIVIGYGLAGAGGITGLEGALIHEGAATFEETTTSIVTAAAALAESPAGTSSDVGISFSASALPAVPALLPTFLAPGDGDAPSDDERADREAALAAKGITRYPYWIVTYKGETIYFVRDPNDPKKFMRIIDHTKMVFVPVGGKQVETDVIDITAPANNLAPLDAEQTKLAERVTGKTPSAWDSHLALTPGDIVLVSMLYSFLGESELGERITKMRADGKSPAEIFADPDVRNAILFSLAVNSVPLGGKCTQVVKHQKRTIKETAQRAFLYIFKRKEFDAIQLAEWITTAFKFVDRSRVGFSSKRYALAIVEFIKEHFGKTITLKQVRAQTDEAIMELLKKKGVLEELPSASVLDERGELTQAFIDFVLTPVGTVADGCSRSERFNALRRAERRIFGAPRHELPGKLVDLLNDHIK